MDNKAGQIFAVMRYSCLAFCASLTHNVDMVFIETPIFTKRVQQLLPDESYSALQQVLLLRPEAGNIMPAVAASENCVGDYRAVVNGAAYA